MAGLLVIWNMPVYHAGAFRAGRKHAPGALQEVEGMFVIPVGRRRIRCFRGGEMSELVWQAAVTRPATV
jgi:hypothetical protein